MKLFADPQIKYRWIIGVLVVLLISVGGWASLHIYDYTEHDPAFCVNCHIMEDAFKSWQTSVHNEVECHDCHYATVWEKNQMLLKAMTQRPTQVSARPHEKIIVPSSRCIQCHWRGDTDVIKISESTGHAMHWFKRSMECTSCHAIRLHQFEPEQKLCLNCHESGRVVLTGMKEMFCTECHNFRQGDLIPGLKVCVNCHQVRAPKDPKAQRVLAHTQFDCMTCHHTHDADRPAGVACKNCHFLTMKRGKHPVHLKALDNDCLACHQPHSWRIDRNSAKRLCSECHEGRYTLAKFK